MTIQEQFKHARRAFVFEPTNSNHGKCYNNGARDSLLKLADVMTTGNKELFDEIREIINKPYTRETE